MNARQRRAHRRHLLATAIVCGANPPPDAESLPDECPWCSNPTESGYGLMGGGCGAYVFCTDEACDFFAKQQDRE